MFKKILAMICISTLFFGSVAAPVYAATENGSPVDPDEPEEDDDDDEDEDDERERPSRPSGSSDSQGSGSGSSGSSSGSGSQSTDPAATAATDPGAKVISSDKVVYGDTVAEEAVAALNSDVISTPEEFFEAADGENKTDPDYLPGDLSKAHFVTKFVGAVGKDDGNGNYTYPKEPVTESLKFDSLVGVNVEDLLNYAIVLVNPEDGTIAFIYLAEYAEDFNPETGEFKITLPFYGVYALMQVEA